MGLFLIRFYLLGMLIKVGSVFDESLSKDLLDELKDINSMSLKEFGQKYGSDIIRKGSEYVLDDMMSISCRAPLSIFPEECSTLYFFLYAKQNGGYDQILNDQQGGPQQYIMEGSLHALLLKMAENLIKNNRAFVSAPVKSIVVSEDKSYSTVTVGDQVIKAKKVVVAMSPVSSKSIDIKPDLPSNFLSLFKNGKIGKTIKGFISYDSKWWNNSVEKLSYGGYYGGVRNTDQYMNLYKEKTGEDDPLVFMWIFDNSIPSEKKNVFMYFIVGDDVTNLLKRVGYQSDWSEEKLQEKIKPVILNSAQHHFGYLFNPKFIPDVIDSSLPDFVPEAFKTTGHDLGIWFENTPFIPGGPDLVLGKGSDDYSALETTPEKQLETTGIIFGSSEYAPVYAGYLTGAMLEGRIIANTLLAGVFGKPVIPETYLNTPFCVSNAGYTFLQTSYQPPFDINLKLYKEWDRVCAIGAKWKNKTQNNKALLACMSEMLVEIQKIQEENEEILKQGLYWAFSPYAGFALILLQEIQKITTLSKEKDFTEESPVFSSFNRVESFGTFNKKYKDDIKYLNEHGLKKMEKTPIDEKEINYS
jgi:hypothetical protein